MATYVEGTSLAKEAEPVGLLTEGAAGIASIVLAIIALAGVSAVPLASIATIVIGVGLMAQGFNTAAENSRLLAGMQAGEWGAEIMVDCLAGGAGVVLGILALIGINPMYLMSAALIVFGGALLLSGALAMQARTMPAVAAGTQVVAYRGSAATGGMEILIGLAAIVLGILSLVVAAGGVLLLVGFIAVGVALLMVSATFSTAVLRIFATTTA
jgi:hypothetical protein